MTGSSVANIKSKSIYIQQYKTPLFIHGIPNVAVRFQYNIQIPVSAGSPGSKTGHSQPKDFSLGEKFLGLVHQLAETVINRKPDYRFNPPVNGIIVVLARHYWV